MALKIITADQRMAQSKGANMVIAGPSGIGKTSLAWTLPADETLFIDMEAGTLALEGWTGDILDVRANALELNMHPWDLLRHIACLASGPNPAVTDSSKPYSRQHYAWAVEQFGTRDEFLGKYRNLFFDSITQSARYCFSWAKTQPEAFSEKTGKPDNRGAYGLLGQEMVGGNGWLGHLQHCPDKSIILVGILQQNTDDYGRKSWALQVDGGKTQLELPGIVDEVISMVEMKADDGTSYRAFVTQTMNPWGYPAKDRSGRLDLIEEPHLGNLITKMTGGRRIDSEKTYTIPDGAARSAVQQGYAEAAAQPPAQPQQAAPEQAQGGTPAA